MAAGGAAGRSCGTPRKVRLVLVQTQAENAGAQEISRLLGDGLAVRGHDVHHLFFFRRTEGADALPNVTFCAERRPRSPRELLGLWRRLRGALREIEPDVVVTFQHYGNLLGAAAARSIGAIPVVANQVSAGLVTNRLIRFADRCFGRFGFYDVITVNSDETARAYAGHPRAYRRRVVHVPHGFMDKTVALGRAEARAGLGLPADGVMLGSVARLHVGKRLDAAIRLLPAEPAWRLALAGQGPDGERLRALAENLGVADRVHFAGELPPSRIGAFLAALDVFVFPTEGETFGLAAVEAAQAGVPVVSSDIPVLRETLAHEGRPAAVFCDAADTEAFRGAVRRILDDTALADALRAAGRRLADRYPLDAMIDAFEALVLAAGRRP